MISTYVALAIVTLAEATIGIFVKLVGNDIPIFTLNFYRAFFAALFLAATMPFFNRHFWHFPTRNFKDTFIIGALIAAQVSIFNIALTLAPIANVVIFWSISPFFAFIFSSLFLGERATREHVLIFIIALLGVVIAEPLSGGAMLGNLIALGSGAVYAALVTYLRYEGKTEKSSDIFWSMFFAAALLSPALLLFGAGDLLALSSQTVLPIAVPVVVWVLLLGVISTGLAYLFIAVAIRKVNANIYSLVDTIVSPIVAAGLAYLIFTEVPSANMIYGGALLIFSGFWLSRLMQHKQPVAANK